MIHGKFLFTLVVKGMYKKFDLELSVYGLFDPQKVHWDYYLISHYTGQNNTVMITDDVCSNSYSIEATYDNIKKYGKKINSIAEGEKYCQEFKMKWDSGSNNTTAEQRDKKLDELLKK